MSPKTRPRSLSSRNSAYYIVLRREIDEGSEIIGYGGMWRMYDEAHVTTIGVRRDLHHGGFGRILFAGLVQAAYDMGAKWITLEVRTSKGYYTDNGEDAIVMWSDSIYSPRVRRAYEANLERIDTSVRGLRREAGPTRDG